MNSEEYKRLKRVRYFIEANFFEQHILWKENSKEYYLNHIGDKTTKDLALLDWVQETDSFTIVIGHINNRPIVLNLNFSYLNDVYVCFYHGCSMIVDYVMINRFLQKNYPKERYTDAPNFHTCLRYCLEEHNKRFYFELI